MEAICCCKLKGCCGVISCKKIGSGRNPENTFRDVEKITNNKPLFRVEVKRVFFQRFPHCYFLDESFATVKVRNPLSSFSLRYYICF